VNETDWIPYDCMMEKKIMRRLEGCFRDSCTERVASGSYVFFSLRSNRGGTASTWREWVSTLLFHTAENNIGTFFVGLTTSEH